MTKVIVTGGSGKLGRATVRELVSHGYSVINADVRQADEPLCPFMEVDFTDMGQTMEALAGMDWDHDRTTNAVVHLAAIPMPGIKPTAEVFRINTISTYNVFEAARRLGIRNVVWASSETLLGIPYAIDPPYVPVDEEYPARPETAYALSKHMGEVMAKEFCRWDPEMKIVCLRLSNVMEPQEYQDFPGWNNSAKSRIFNLWTYIDARDGAQAIRLSLEYNKPGMEVFVIANADGVMTRPNSELLAECYPNVPLKRSVGDNETLLSIEKARRLLGYEPRFSWRDEVKG